MLGLVVGHCYLCWGRDRRLTHAVQIHAGLMFVCVSDLSIHRCGKCVQHLSKPLCCEDITSIVCVLSFFVLWEILSLRAPSRCPLRHYAANSVMEVEQDLCSYTFLSSDTQICTVDQASQCWTLRQLRGTELKKKLYMHCITHKYITKLSAPPTTWMCKYILLCHILVWPDMLGCCII